MMSPLHLQQVTRWPGLPSPTVPILTRDRGHQCAQPLMLLLEGSTDFPHIFQALGAKEKRLVQSCVGDNLPIPIPPFHLLPLFSQCWIWYLFRAGRCVLGGSQSVLGCLAWKTQGRARLVIETLCESALRPFAKQPSPASTRLQQAGMQDHISTFPVPFVERQAVQSPFGEPETALNQPVPFRTFLTLLRYWGGLGLVLCLWEF